MSWKRSKARMNATCRRGCYSNSHLQAPSPASTELLRCKRGIATLILKILLKSVTYLEGQAQAVHLCLLNCSKRMPLISIETIAFGFCYTFALLMFFALDIVFHNFLRLFLFALTVIYNPLLKNVFYE